jgi:predicted small metal-binding protein
MKELKCKDLGMDCPFVSKGATKAVVKKLMATHGMKVHGEEMAHMTKAQMDKMDKKMDELLSK